MKKVKIWRQKLSTYILEDKMKFSYMIIYGHGGCLKIEAEIIPSIGK